MSQHEPSGDSGGFRIAVVGMAGRFPGAESVAEFWDNLRDGVESIAQLSEPDLLAAGVPREVFSNSSYVRASASLAEIDQWDAPFFGFNPREAAVMDPQHRLFLECAWEALEDAGHMPANFPGSVAVFAGCGMQSYFTRNLAPNVSLMDDMGYFLVRHTGNDKDFLATRVSYCFNLRGPSMNIQTACSTSLVAIHVAVQSLVSGECDMALAGGVSIEVPHGQGYLFDESGVASPDGHCRSFDADGRGTLFGSGAGVVVLRRLEDALADGDHIYAVVRGSAVNNDGASKVGYLAPSVDGQSRAAAEALAVADVDARSIEMLEAHGTATPVGDPIEIAALTQAYGTGVDAQWCATGSVKSNMGHLDTAAGVASFMKAALALQNEVIPASLNYTRPNPSIDFVRSPFFVNANRKAWPRRSHSPRRAAVNSLGVGGTNAHVILEEAPLRPQSVSLRESQLLVLSARSQGALASQAEHLAQYLEETPNANLADVAYTLREGRHAFRERRALVARSVDHAIQLLRSQPQTSSTLGATASEQAVTTAFMFAGGGAQRAGMAAELFAGEPVFASAVERCLSLLPENLRNNVRMLLLGAEGEADVTSLSQRPSIALPALFSTQYAMTRLMQSWGVQCSAMIGHSMGEYTAAHLAGVMSLDDTLKLICLRGRLFEQVSQGGMLSVELGEQQLRELMPPAMSIAAANAPGLTVASGALQDIAEMEKLLATREVPFSRVRIDVAAHSAMLEPILGEFAAFLRTIKLSTPLVPFLSNVSGDWITDRDATDPDYWVRHLRNTVRFADGIETLLRDRNTVLLELGPGRTLATLGRSHPSAEGRTVLTSMRAHDDRESTDSEAALSALGALWAAGVVVPWEKLIAGEVRYRVPLPTYPFERQRHWIDAPAAHGITRDPGVNDGALAGTTVGAAADATAGLSGRSIRTPVAQWFQSETWRRHPTASPPEELKFSGAAIVFADNNEFSLRMVEQLRTIHNRLVIVESGTSFAQQAHDRFMVNPGVAEHFARLFAAVAADGAPLDRIVHLWCAGSAAADDNGGGNDAALERLMVRNFYSVAHVMQGWGEWMAGASATSSATDAGAGASSASVMKKPQFALVTSQMCTVGAENAGDPYTSLAGAVARVASAEYPEMNVRVVDVATHNAAASHAPAAITSTAAAVLRELRDPNRPPLVALRGNECWLPLHTEIALPKNEKGISQSLPDGAVCIITGGLGGVGLITAEYLAEHFHARLVLVSRNTSHPGADAAVHRLKELGAEVHLVAADVSTLTGARTAVAEAMGKFGIVNAVFHAAGLLDDGLLQLRSDEEFAAVLAPKVQGTVALHQALAGVKLNAFVLYSSVSATAAVMGQADYTAANSFIDAFARWRREREQDNTVAVQWGSWRNVGMTLSAASALTNGGPLSTYEADIPGRGAAHPQLQHPFLDEVLFSGNDQIVFQTRLNTNTSWIVGEHRLCDGTALIPGTGYLEIALAAFNAAARLPVAVQDVAFLAPFALMDGKDRAFRTSMRTAGAEKTFIVAGEAGGSWYELASGTIGGAVPPASHGGSLAEIQARCTRLPSVPINTAAHPHLKLGGRWNNIRDVKFGTGEAIGTFALQPDSHDDVAHLTLHPALLDMATACALELISDYDVASDFYVPLGYNRLVVYKPLPAEFVSHVRLAESELDPREVAVFDITLMDRSGAILTEIAGFMMTRVVDTRAMLAAGQRRRPFVMPRGTPVARAVAPPEILAEAITPAEGKEALELITRGGLPSNVAVCWQPMHQMVARLHALSAPPLSQRTPKAKAPDPSLKVLEAALATHPAVADCLVMERPDRTGSLKTVCYVVFARNEHATVSELRRHVKPHTPAGRRPPSNFVAVDTIPRTADGRVDDAELPDPFGVADTHIAPRTETEAAIATAWMEALGMPRVSVRDNFFDIGGHSLLAVRVVTRLDKQLGVRLSQAIMILQTLEQIAAECDRQISAGSPRLKAGRPQRVG